MDSTVKYYIRVAFLTQTFEDLEDRSILARLATRSIEQLEDSAQSTTTGNTRNSESTPRARAGTYSGVLASNNPVENGGDLHASPSIAPAAATAGAHEVGHKMNVIEHYIKCISHLEHILLMDRLRQVCSLYYLNYSRLMASRLPLRIAVLYMYRSSPSKNSFLRRQDIVPATTLRQ